MFAKPQMWWPGINRKHSLARGLVACWPFWEGAGGQVKDVVNDNSGVLTNMDPASDWIGSPFGYALDFDGDNDEIQIASTPSIEIGDGDFTASAWVYITTLITWTTIFSKDPGGNVREYALFIDVAGDAWAAGGGDTGASISMSPKVTAGTWHLLTLVGSPSLLEVYLDGSLAGFHTTRGTNTTTAILRLGNDVTDTFELLGYFGQMLLYNRTLDVDENRKLYTDPFAMLRIPPLARRYVPTAPAAGIVVLRRRRECA